MANRRMFAKTIIDSDAFLDMPLSTQALYFHLSMRADDDGFINNPKKIMRMIGCNDDEMKILIARNYILIFESGVIVIKHWKMHNYIQKDRYHKTVYQEEFKQLEAEENGTYNKNLISMDTKCIQDVSEVDTQVRLGKVSIDNNTYVQEKNLERPAKKDIKNEKYYPLSEKLKTNIQKISPNAIIKDAQLKTWSNDFRLMVEQDSRTYEFIDTLLDKVFKDEFWSNHIRSAGKLRIRLNEGKLDNVGRPKPKFEQTNIFNQQYMPEYMQKAMKQ